jgi:hypothetical protein
MAPIPVQIKHAGKLYDIQLDQDLPPNAFKEAIYQLTGVPIDRMKIMVKGGVLKACPTIFSSVMVFILALEHRTIHHGRKSHPKQDKRSWSSVQQASYPNLRQSRSFSLKVCLLLS